MALNRFYQPGQSQYMSQYVSHKLPFELWQQEVQQADAKVDETSQMLKSLYGQKITGTDVAQLGQYSKSIYGDNEQLSRLISDIGEIQIGDRTSSLKSSEAIDNRLNEIFSDDYIFKTLTGDLADDIIQVNGMVKQHNTMNEIYDQRTKALDGIYKSIADKKDWELDPSLIFQQEQELLKMIPTERNPKGSIYVPKETGVGDYFDSSKYILDEVNRMKNSGGKSYDLSDPLYEKWNSWEGVKASQYRDFAEDIWNNENSQVRVDAERRISAYINAGYYKESDRAALLEYEKQKLLNTAENLKHGISDTGRRFMSGEERDTILANTAMPIDVATTVQNLPTSTNFNTLEGNFNKLNELTATTSEYLLANYGIAERVVTDANGNQVDVIPGYKVFANMSEQELTQLAFQKGIPLNALIEQQKQMSALAYKYDDAYQKYSVGKSMLEEGTGYNDSARKTEALYTKIKTNPALAQRYMLAIEDPSNPLYKSLINTPEYQELQTLKQYSPDLYAELYEGVTEGNTLGLYTANDFMINGKWYPNDAIQFLRNNGIEPNLSDGGAATFTQSDFNRIVRENSGQYKLQSSVQDLNQRKLKYQAGSEITLGLNEGNLVTRPGMYITANGEEINKFKTVSNPVSSSLVVNGEERSSSFSKKVLIDYILNPKNGSVPMVMVSPTDFRIDGIAIGEILNAQTEEEKKLFANELSVQMFGEGIESISVDQTKELNAELDMLYKNPESYTLMLKTDKSQAFTGYIGDKVSQGNARLDWNNPNKLDDNQRSVYTENVISNKSSIDQLEKTQQNTSVVNTGGATSAGYIGGSDVNMPITITSYVGGKNITNYTIVSVQPNPNQQTDPNNPNVITRTNVNGSPSTSTSNPDMLYKTTSGTYVNGSQSFIYMVKEPISGEVFPVPALHPEEVIQYLSDIHNTPNQ